MWLNEVINYNSFFGHKKNSWLSPIRNLILEEKMGNGEGRFDAID